MQIGEDGMSVLLLATWPAMEEREKEIFLVEVGGRKKIFWEKWNFGKLEFLWIVEEGKK